MNGIRSQNDTSAPFIPNYSWALLVVGCILLACGKESVSPASSEQPKPVVVTQEQPAPVVRHTPEKKAVKVVSARGSVSTRRGQNSKWSRLNKGDSIAPASSIRTSPDGKVEISIGNATTVTLDEEGEIQLPPDEGKAPTLNLKSGRVNVTHNSNDSETLTISSGETQAQTSGGEFAMENREGNVTVAANDGTVQFSAQDKSVSLAAGEYSVATKESAPSDARPIPLDVMLKVAQNARTVENTRHTLVRGTADPGATVLVNGKTAVVDETGQFKVKIPLKPGQNPLEISARTLWGAKTRRLPAITMVQAADVKDVSVRWNGGSSP